jgi:hypothetical protein
MIRIYVRVKPFSRGSYDPAIIIIAGEDRFSAIRNLKESAREVFGNATLPYNSVVERAHNILVNNANAKIKPYRVSTDIWSSLTLEVFDSDGKKESRIYHNGGGVLFSVGDWVQFFNDDYIFRDFHGKCFEVRDVLDVPHDMIEFNPNIHPDENDTGVGHPQWVYIPTGKNGELERYSGLWLRKVD